MQILPVNDIQPAQLMAGEPTGDTVVETPPVGPLGIMRIDTGDIRDVPDLDYPFYVQHTGGFMVAKPTFFGQAVVPIAPPKHAPKPPPPIGSKGVVWLNGQRVPGYIVHQAIDFFRRILKNHGTEAALILTTKDGRWRCFIPEQYTSHGGVNMKYDSAHIQVGWMQVGTIHSHCDFSAFHSGTDQHDADGFEGIHLTIGMLNKERPQIAQMLAFNKSYLNLKEDDAIDWSNMDGPVSAPPWWDRYVHPHGTAPWGSTGISYAKPGINGRPVYPRSLYDWHDVDDFVNGATNVTPIHSSKDFQAETAPTPNGWRSMYIRAERYLVPQKILANFGYQTMPFQLPNGYERWEDVFAAAGIDIAGLKMVGPNARRILALTKAFPDGFTPVKNDPRLQPNWWPENAPDKPTTNHDYITGSETDDSYSAWLKDALLEDDAEILASWTLEDYRDVILQETKDTIQSLMEDLALVGLSLDWKIIEVPTDTKETTTDA